MRILPSIRLWLIALVALAMPALAVANPVPAESANADVDVLITFGPPAIPVYEQPICPGEGYIWTPGYWAWWDGDYYWVPGTWVLIPEPGFFWTPGYWAWAGDRFVFYDGYWGPHVGFYGGINYGFGYFGEGYEGGRWDHDRFYYNRAVNNINVTEIHNVYVTNVTNYNSNNRVSYNGGEGGLTARATAQEEAAARERHIPPVAAQMQHVEAARNDPQQRASANHGKPEVAATFRPGAFSGREVMHAKAAGAPYHPPASRPNSAPREVTPGARPENNAARSSPPIHPRDLSPMQPMTPPSTGNAKLDQKYQKEQEKLRMKQDQELQKLQQKQEKDHQRMEQQKADDARRQQMEQRHQQQTQQMRQQHEQQRQQMQQRQQPPPRREQSKPQREGRPPGLGS